MSKALFALPIVVLALSASASAVTTITTTGAWAGSNFAVGFGNGEFTHLGSPTSATSTYGQTFVAPADSYLKTYTSKFAFNTGNQFTYRLFIAAWSDVDNVAVGTPLFQSSSMTSLASTVTGFQDVSVNVNTQLVAGTKYVAFYSTTKENVLNQGSMKFAITDSPAYSGGDFAYSGSDYNTLFTDSWTTNYTPNDTVFSATFTTAVPEPASMVGLGLGALVLLRRRRK